MRTAVDGTDAHVLYVHHRSAHFALPTALGDISMFERNAAWDDLILRRHIQPLRATVRVCVVEKKIVPYPVCMRTGWIIREPVHGRIFGRLFDYCSE
jgi:hypothetical protein